MSLLKKLRDRVINRKQKAALEYLQQKMAEVKYKDKPLNEYFDMKYVGNCYYYSTYMFLCLGKNSKLVRGTISLKKSEDNKPYYHHGWVEFEHNGEWFVYDDHYYYPIPIKLWYEVVSPYVIDAKFTQTELIEYVYDNYKEKFNIKEQEDKKIVSTEYIWDGKFCIPFMYIDLVVKDNQITKVEIDKDDVYTQYVKRAPIVDWA